MGAEQDAGGELVAAVRAYDEAKLCLVSAEAAIADPFIKCDDQYGALLAVLDNARSCERSACLRVVEAARTVAAERESDPFAQLGAAWREFTRVERDVRAVAEIRADLAPVEASRPEWVRLEDGGYEASWLGLLLCVWREDDEGPWWWGVAHRPMDEPWSPDSEPTRELAQRRAEAVAEALTRAL
jgi:hypothetical protein